MHGFAIAARHAARAAAPARLLGLGASGKALLAEALVQVAFFAENVERRQERGTAHLWTS